jgi:hypothetical protein
MAKPNTVLIEALRNTIRRLETGTSYQWGHMGSCNCGHLAQELTNMSKTEIHTRAMQKYGDWSEQLNDYCPTSGLLMDDLISHMLSCGLTTTDLQHLERLSDPLVLRRIKGYEKGLAHNQKQDVIRYIKAWTLLLEEMLAEKVILQDLDKKVYMV